MKELFLASLCFVFGAFAGIFLLAFASAAQEKSTKDDTEWPLL